MKMVEKRSKMMSAVKSKDTKPEIAVRKILYSAGYRYRLHAKDIPGKPDIVIRRLKTAIFINGCFWHGHDCPLFTIPKTRSEFWKAKIESNIKRDKDNLSRLQQIGYKVIIVWGCSMKGKTRLIDNELASILLQSLFKSESVVQIEGT